MGYRPAHLVGHGRARAQKSPLVGNFPAGGGNAFLWLEDDCVVRTNHQRVMEHGDVRPAHPVEHHALELEKISFLGISRTGGSPVAVRPTGELVGLEPTTKVYEQGGVRPA